MSLSDMIKVLKTVQFGTLYIKPAFVFADSNGHLKLQFEADPYSSMGYLYDNLCQMLGVKWNNISSYNSLGFIQAVLCMRQETELLMDVVLQMPTLGAFARR